MVDNVVAVDFLVIILRDFARIGKQRVKQFRILINGFVKFPVEIAGAFPKFNRIFLANSKEVM